MDQLVFLCHLELLGILTVSDDSHFVLLEYFVVLSQLLILPLYLLGLLI